MQEFIIGILVLLLIFLLFKGKKSGKHVHTADCVTRIIPPTPIESETSLIELEANCRRAGSIANADMPDIVGNMWNTETSFPELDSKMRYVTTTGSDFETPSWNRYSLSHICSLDKMAKAVFPSKYLVFS